MTSDVDSKLSEDEVDAIRQMSREHRQGIDTDEVQQLVTAGREKFQRTIENRDFSEWSPEERVANSLLAIRPYIDQNQIIPVQILSSEFIIRKGINLIQQLDGYWRIEPCLDCIFELEPTVLEKAIKFITKFEESDYDIAAQQYYHSIMDNITEIRDIEKQEQKKQFNRILDDFDKIIDKFPGLDFIPPLVTAKRLEIYSDLVEYFEITFPNLLALKRLLDGENVDIEVLQNKSANSVRRELTNTDNLYSAYFDLIINAIDIELRNALAHGDIVNDSVEREVRIPSKNRSYSYEKIEELVTQNFSCFIFLSGPFHALIQWRWYTHEIDEISREHLAI